MLLSSTPREDGFRMPGEFELHNQCWMLWPERGDVWRNAAKPAQQNFSQVANAIINFESLTIGVSHKQYENAIQKLDPRIRIIELSYNDAWVRDNGPTFVMNDAGTLRGINWRFNAWGGLDDGMYFPWDKDDLVALKILQVEKIDYYKPENFVLEGGSIHVDGDGTLLTTKQCLLNQNRNPHLSQSRIEDYLKNYLNVDHIIWLEDGLYNDETNGHIDNLCCFIQPGVVALGWTDDRNNPNYDVCRRALSILKREKDARGRCLEIYLIPLPKGITITPEEYETIDFSHATYRSKPADIIPASYINFLICNEGIIAPIFHDEKDEEAMKILENLFPSRKVVPIYSREIILGGGNIHCITQQQPETPRESSANSTFTNYSSNVL